MTRGLQRVVEEQYSYIRNRVPCQTGLCPAMVVLGMADGKSGTGDGEYYL